MHTDTVIHCVHQDTTQYNRTQHNTVRWTIAEKNVTAVPMEWFCKTIVWTKPTRLPGNFARLLGSQQTWRIRQRILTSNSIRSTKRRPHLFEMPKSSAQHHLSLEQHPWPSPLTTTDQSPPKPPLLPKREISNATRLAWPRWPPNYCHAESWRQIHGANWWKHGMVNDNGSEWFLMVPITMVCRLPWLMYHHDGFGFSMICLGNHLLYSFQACGIFQSTSLGMCIDHCHWQHSHQATSPGWSLGLHDAWCYCFDML